MENPSLPIVRNLENVFLIDWLSVTFHGCRVDEVQSLLGLTSCDWTTSSSFINGYPMVTEFSNIHIRWGADDPRFYTDTYDKSGRLHSAESKARSDMGIQLELSGQGCRSFEEFSSFSWFELIERIYRFGGRFNVTRLDLAYDDHSGLLNIWQLRYDVENRHYISKARKVSYIWSDDLDDDLKGLTINVGSKSSPVMIRIYNKAAERGYGTEKHWIRVELQLRQERAAETLRLLFRRESIGIVASGIIRNYCCFCTPTNDSNRSRWPVAEYWERVLEGMEKLRIWIAPGEEYNLSKTERHMILQYGQFIQAYFALHHSLGSLLSESQRLHPNLKPKYLNAISTELTRREMHRENIHMFNLEHGFSDPEEIAGNVQRTFAELFDEDPDLPDQW